MKIGIIGECMIELQEKTGKIERSFGGDTLNTAVYLKRCAPKIETHYITALGTDPFSEEMLLAWQNEHLNISLVQKLPEFLPGLYFIENDSFGERRFYYWRKNSAATNWLKTNQSENIEHEMLSFDFLYLSGISAAILPKDSQEKLLNLLKKCKKNGSKIIFDNNFREKLWQNKNHAKEIYQQILALTDFAFLTQEDEQSLWNLNSPNDIIEHAKMFGISEIIVKCGENPCEIYADKKQISVPANIISSDFIVDTTAAGDSFSAGYLAKRLMNENAENSAKFAHLLASKVIQHKGAILPLSKMPI